MANQELIKLICALAAFACVASGIYGLFIGLRAEGLVDFSALLRGKLKTGSAGVMLLFFGAVLFGMLVLKGATATKRDITEIVGPVSATNADVASRRSIHEESGGRNDPNAAP
jgi:hypothetical protein